MQGIKIIRNGERDSTLIFIELGIYLVGVLKSNDIMNN